MIHEINSNLTSVDLFFEETIPTYKKLATIQVLLNTWRDESLKEAVGETVELEERLIEYMLEAAKKTNSSDEALSMTTEDIDRLVVNIMTEKVNKKYNTLSSEQKKIINLYVFSKDDPGARSQLIECLDNIKDRFLAALGVHGSEFDGDQVLKGKLQEVRDTLKQKEYQDLSQQEVLSEDLVSFYLGLSRLEGEVRAREEHHD